MSCLFLFSFTNEDIPDTITFKTSNKLTKVDGTFEKWKIISSNHTLGKLNDLALEAEINMTTVYEDNKKLNSSLKKEEFFHVDSFPKAHVSVFNVQQISKMNYLAEGKVTLKGITKPISFAFEMTDLSPIRVKGSTKINRRDFEVGRLNRTYHGLNDSVEVLFDLEIP